MSGNQKIDREMGERSLRRIERVEEQNREYWGVGVWWEAREMGEGEQKQPKPSMHENTLKNPATLYSNLKIKNT